MGRFSVAEPANKINYLHPHHRSMARMVVKRGLRNKELAAMYDFTPGQISAIINSPLFRVEVARMEALAEEQSVDVVRDLKSMQGRSMEVIAEDLHGKDRRLRSNTAFEVLDRTGHPKGAPEQKHQHQHLHAHAVKTLDKMDKRQVYEEVMNLIEEEDEG